MTLAIGEYVARVQNAEFTESKNGHPQLVVSLEVDSDEGPVSHRVWITFIEAYPEIAKEQLRAAGWVGTEVSKLEGFGSVPCKLVGKVDKKDPTRVNWNLRSLAGAPLRDDQRLAKDKLSRLDAVFSDVKTTNHSTTASSTFKPAAKPPIRQI